MCCRCSRRCCGLLRRQLFRRLPLALSFGLGTSSRDGSSLVPPGCIRNASPRVLMGHAYASARLSGRLSRTPPLLRVQLPPVRIGIGADAILTPHRRRLESRSPTFLVAPRALSFARARSFRLRTQRR
jgi:hypothetical protein